MMGGLRCHMPGCKNKGSSGFHKFPRDFETCRVWQRLSNRPYMDTNKLPYSSFRLCNLHFTKDDYIRSCNQNGQLKKGAVPSLFVPKESLVYDDHNYAKMQTEQLFEQPQSEVYDDHNYAKMQPEQGVEQPQSENNNDPKCSSSTGPFADSMPASAVPKVNLSQNDTKRKETEKLRRKLRYTKGRVAFLQKKLKESTNLSKEKVVQYLSTKFSGEQMSFFMMQLRNSERKNHGQSYTTEEKSMLLALYRHGAKSYRFLSGVFSLPSKRTLSRHSALLQFKTGINPKLFQFLKSKASQLDELDKYCTIGWDEIALTSHLNLCETVYAMDGFVDLGEIQIPEFATHALVFMIRGINQAYKQPIAYFFTDNLDSLQLSELIRLVISAVFKTGMKIIGSVCDQTSTNAAAVNKLAYPGLQRVTQKGQLLSYTVDGNRIIHCFDPPHILKVIRNNLYDKNLVHFVSDAWNYESVSQTYPETVSKVASWDHVREFYNINAKNTSRLLRKITDEHIDPVKLKMKVYIAAQVFSNTFGNIMLYCSKNNHLSEDFSGTARILTFVNDLFDSLNGAEKSNVNPLRSAIDLKNKDKHFRFWAYAIQMLEKMYFVDKVKGEVINTSTVLKKTISTIKGYMELTDLCLNLGMKSVSLRRMNQDGLENFFGNVKAACYTKKQPMPFQFRSAFTNLIVTGLTSKHSMKSNCEDDQCIALLQDVYDFYDMDIDNEEEEAEDDEDVIDLDVDLGEKDPKVADTDVLSFECGKVCRKVLSQTKCESCKNTVEAYCPLTQHGIIQGCDRSLGDNESLFTYPTLLFTDKFQILINKIEVLLPMICHEKTLSQQLITSVENCTLEGLGCKEHSGEMSLRIKTLTVKYAIATFMKSVNGILSRKILQAPKNQNIIHEKALKIIKKKSGIGKYGQNLII